MNVFIICSLFIYCVIATPITTNNNKHKITEGFDAYPGQFPYQALIQFLNEPEALCGGSIISNQWILTTAACITVAEPNKMRVMVGSIYRNSGGTIHTVLFSVKHPDYILSTYTNDIGVIRINGQISYNDFVRPIQLSSDSISVGLPLTTSGWGARIALEETLPNTLQYTTIKSITLDNCKNLIKEFPLFDTHLCTHTSNKQGLCDFDNGNPLVYKGQQHAIVSLPVHCHDNRIPDIHTRVAPFRSWIKEITNV